MGELEDINQKQAQYYRENHHDGSIMRCSLGEFISKRITQEKMSDNQMKEVLGDIKNMRQTYNLPPAAYWAIIFRTYA